MDAATKGLIQDMKRRALRDPLLVTTEDRVGRKPGLRTGSQRPELSQVVQHAQRRAPGFQITSRPWWPMSPNGPGGAAWRLKKVGLYLSTTVRFGS